MFLYQFSTYQSSITSGEGGKQIDLLTERKSVLKEYNWFLHKSSDIIWVAISNQLLASQHGIQASLVVSTSPYTRSAASAQNFVCVVIVADDFGSGESPNVHVEWYHLGLGSTGCRHGSLFESPMHFRVVSPSSLLANSPHVQSHVHFPMPLCATARHYCQRCSIFSKNYCAFFVI